MHPVLPRWIDLVGTIVNLRAPKQYLQRMGDAVEVVGADDQLRQAWSLIDHRPVELFVWFHDGTEGPKSIARPGDVFIRAYKDRITVQMTSLATRKKGPLPQTAGAVAADLQLVLTRVQERFGISVPSRSGVADPPTSGQEASAR